MKKIVTSLILIFTAFVVFVSPAYAAENKCVPTSILGGSACTIDKDNKATFKHKVDSGHPLANGEVNCSCDDGEGSSVTDTLNLVVDIMTIGIGILGVIGITIVGIQYLTAGGSEEKTRKAKRRMFEIVIGLVAYVVLYAFVKWLIPNFKG